MYFGSVRFYKHLIYLFLIVVTLLAVYGFCFIRNIFVDNYYGRSRDNNSNQEELMEYRNKGDSLVISKSILPVKSDSGTTMNDQKKGTVDSNLNVELQSSEITDKMQENDLSVQEEQPNSSQGLQELVSRGSQQIRYQFLYPELRNEMPVIEEQESKTVYLTFDDGPSARTVEILDILKERGIKATFFVVSNNSNLDILKRIAEEGHAIGVHSHTHEYSEIYDSVEAFLDDFNTCYNKIYEVTSVKPQIFRFPGGSINAYNMGIYQDIISEMLRRGFIFYDWNISTQDTAKKADKGKVIESVEKGFYNQDSIIVLAHDSHNKSHTVEALPEIISFFEEKGYSFDKLDNSIEPIVFPYIN